MKAKDRLFMILATVLILLFAAQIFLNLPKKSRFGLEAEAEPRLFQPRQEDIAGIMSRLEEAGLEPQEAKYYTIYNE